MVCVLLVVFFLYCKTYFGGGISITISLHIHTCVIFILSLKLFNIYIDGLSNILNNSLTGGSLGGRRINNMLYADDLCIVSLSSAGLQKLLSICDEYCASHSITFNVKKSVCMFFKCIVNKHCDNSTVFLSGNQIDFEQEVKYLWVLLNPSMKTSIDVSRQTRKFFAQANMLLRKFSVL